MKSFCCNIPEPFFQFPCTFSDRIEYLLGDVFKRVSVKIDDTMILLRWDATTLEFLASRVREFPDTRKKTIKRPALFLTSATKGVDRNAAGFFIGEIKALRGPAIMRQNVKRVHSWLRLKPGDARTRLFLWRDAFLNNFSSTCFHFPCFSTPF